MPSTKRTVLIVDDEEVIREAASEMLRSMGYAVLAASSGPEALELSAARECTIDLLLTDLIMPGMTGRVLAEVLAARCPGLQVIFMSGYVEVSRRGAHENDGYYLQKPLSMKKLGELMNSLLGAPRKKS